MARETWPAMLLITSSPAPDSESSVTKVWLLSCHRPTTFALSPPAQIEFFARAGHAASTAQYANLSGSRAIRALFPYVFHAVILFLPFLLIYHAYIRVRDKCISEGRGDKNKVQRTFGKLVGDWEQWEHEGTIAGDSNCRPFAFAALSSVRTSAARPGKCRGIAASTPLLPLAECGGI